MNVYVVHRLVPGFSRSDPESSNVVGVYKDEQTANRVALACMGATFVAEVKVNHIDPGIKERIKMIYGEGR